MRTKLLVLLCLMACKAIQGQIIDITGTWTIFEMTRTINQEAIKTTEEELNDRGFISDYFFMSDGKFKLTSNMTGSGDLETEEGTWKLEGDKLTYTIQFGEDLVDSTWDFDFKDDVIYLSTSSPDGSRSVVNALKRK